jgi:hypothetical protein
MLSNGCAPFRNASDALKWKQQARQAGTVPQYANPYYTPAGCNHQHSAGAAQSEPCCAQAPRFAPGQAGRAAR